MRTLSQYFIIAKNSINRKPIYEMAEIEELCSKTPSVDIGKIKLKANFFRRHIMKFLSLAAVGILVTALYILSLDTEYKVMSEVIGSAKSVNQSTSNNQSTTNTKSHTLRNTISAPEFSPENIKGQDENLFAAMRGGIYNLFDQEDEKATPEKQNTLMGYPIIVLSKQEAQNLGFIYEDDEIIYRHKARIDLPFENNYISKEQYVGASKFKVEKLEDKGYDITKDTMVYEEININDEHPYSSLLEKEDAKDLNFSNITALSMRLLKTRKSGMNTYINNFILSPAPPIQLSKFMADEYQKKLSLFEVDKITDDKLFEDYSHFYIDTSYKSAEVFKKFVNIIIPINDDDETMTLTGWFLLNKELASKLPKRYQADIKYKYQITESDYYTESDNTVAIFIDKDAKLPWTKVSFIPNHLPIYGTDSKGEYSQIRSSELEKISAYLSKKIPKQVFKKISQSDSKTIDILSQMPEKSKEIKLLLTLLKSDKTKSSGVNSLELDAKELSKLDVKKSNNEISYPMAFINKEKEITLRRFRYQFSLEELEVKNIDASLSNGVMGKEYFNINYKDLSSKKKMHNYNPLIPVAFSMNSKFTFYNSPCFYYAKNATINSLYKKQDYDSDYQKQIESNIILPIYVHDGDDFEMIGSKPESYAPYLSMLDRLIPIKIETGFKNIPGPVYLWYLPTTEFLNALPERYSKSIRKELAILDKIENQNMEPEKACKGFDEESFFGICDLSSGALSNIKIAPNPCLFDLNISFLATDTRSVNIQIFDINGRSVKTLGNYKLTDFGEQNYNFDISSLKTGIYQLVIISDQGEKISKRFIKQ